MSSRLALVLVALTTALPAAAQEPPPVNARALDAHLRYLADDLLEGRAPATRGGQLAAGYIAAQFQASGQLIVIHMVRPCSWGSAVTQKPATSSL